MNHEDHEEDFFVLFVATGALAPPSQAPVSGFSVQETRNLLWLSEMLPDT